MNAELWTVVGVVCLLIFRGCFEYYETKKWRNSLTLPKNTALKVRAFSNDAYKALIYSANGEEITSAISYSPDEAAKDAIVAYYSLAAKQNKILQTERKFNGN